MLAWLPTYFSDSLSLNLARAAQVGKRAADAALQGKMLALNTPMPDHQRMITCWCSWQLLGAICLPPATMSPDAAMHCSPTLLFISTPGPGVAAAAGGRHCSLSAGGPLCGCPHLAGRASGDCAQGITGMHAVCCCC